jgi:cation transport ATPase
MCSSHGGRFRVTAHAVYTAGNNFKLKCSTASEEPMAKSKSHSKSNNKPHSSAKNSAQSSVQPKAQAKSQPTKAQPKHRSTLLAIAIVAVILYGIIMAAVYWTVAPDTERTLTSISVWVAFLASAAQVVAGVALWFWKKWGIYLFGISAAATAAVTVLVTGDLFLLFGSLLPAVIVLYIIMTHRAKFE